MSKFAPWTAKRFFAGAGAILVVVAVIGGLSWPHLQAYAAKRAAEHAAIAAHEPDASKAMGEYALAHALDPGNPTYRVQLADRYTIWGEPEKALALLQPLSTPAAAVSRTKAYLEEGRGDTAAEAASLHLAGNGLVLAQELYAHQLCHSSQRVVAEVSDSPAKYLLLAQVLLAEEPSSHAQVVAAQSAAQRGIRFDPASLPLHELLQSIDNQLGDHNGSAQEQQLITQLQSGNI